MHLRKMYNHLLLGGVFCVSVFTVVDLWLFKYSISIMIVLLIVLLVIKSKTLKVSRYCRVVCFFNSVQFCLIYFGTLLLAV